MKRIKRLICQLAQLKDISNVGRTFSNISSEVGLTDFPGDYSLFSFELAIAYYSTNGGHLPTTSELKGLYFSAFEEGSAWELD